MCALDPWYVVLSEIKSIKPFQLFVVGKVRKPFHLNRRQLEWLQNASLANPRQTERHNPTSCPGAGPEHFGIVAVDCAKARSKWARVWQTLPFHLNRRQLEWLQNASLANPRQTERHNPTSCPGA